MNLTFLLLIYLVGGKNVLWLSIMQSDWLVEQLSFSVWLQVVTQVTVAVTNVDDNSNSAVFVHVQQCWFLSRPTRACIM